MMNDTSEKELTELRAENEALRSEIGKWVTDYQAQKMRNDRLEWERGNIDEVFRAVSDREIKFRTENEALKEREHTNDTLLAEQGDKLAALNDELAELRAFKWACERQAAVATIQTCGSRHSVSWSDRGIAGFDGGTLLYARPDPEAAQLRMLVKKLDEHRDGRLAALEKLVIAERQRDLAVDALDKLARLGNGDLYGNSEGNVIAQQALAAITREVKE